MNKIKRLWWMLLAIPLLLAAGFVGWAELTPTPMEEAMAALQRPARTDDVVVTTRDWLTFRPADEEPGSGLVFYPGGRVDPRSYAPAARAIAWSGHMIVIVPMPLNLAFLAPNQANDVIESFPEISAWAVGGHSLGGAMAARFAHRNPSAVDGLVMWAAYPPRADDLSERDLHVVSIYGTLDGLATPQEIAASRPLLPPDARWVAIEGGNHAQFGWYGPQPGDNPATVSRETQQQHVIDATVALLEELDG